MQHPHGRMGGIGHVGYMQPSAAAQPSRAAWLNATRPGQMAAAGVPMGHIAPSSVAHSNVTGPQRGVRGQPPRREMDSLLEEIKAKQKLQDERKELLKNAGTTAEAGRSDVSTIAIDPRTFGSPAALNALPRLGVVASSPQTAIASTTSAGAIAASATGVSATGGAVSACGLGGLGAGLGAGSVAGSGIGGVTAGDPAGVTLFLRELPFSADEERICQLFSRYGCVTAVDIMCPQDQPEKRRQGYVTLDTRENASRAKDALQDRDFDGIPLSIEWALAGPPGRTAMEMGMDSTRASKDASLGSRHILVTPPADTRKRRMIDTLARYVSQEGHPFEQAIMERESPDGNFGFLFQHGTPENIYYRWRTFAFAQGDVKAWRTSTFRLCEGGAWWWPPHCEVKIEEKKRSTNFSSAPPKSAAARAAEASAKAAASSANADGSGGSAGGGGASTENAVPGSATQVTVGNAATAAAAAAASASSISVDADTSSAVSMAVKPFSSLPSSWTAAHIEEERERQRLEERATLERQKRDRDRRGIAGGKRLLDADWDRLEQVLRAVTCARPQILEAMAFCLDKSDHAIEITECITESLTIFETELMLKISRFMVVSDVLHNTCSSKPSAWAYRREFERSLPDILEHFHAVFSRVESRIQADRARDQVIRILRVWEDWGLFAPQYVRGLEASLVIGVCRLRFLAEQGDSSREPGWLEPKLADWRRQHFSQLEKMCRTRGLRSSTSHLEACKDLTLEEVKREWLIDRLVCYELHSHMKEQERANADAAAARAAVEAADAMRRSRKRRHHKDEDLDGEAIDSIDGVPISDAELDGDPMESLDPGELLRLAELTALTVNPCGIGGLLLGSCSGGGDSLNDGLNGSLGMHSTPGDVAGSLPVRADCGQDATTTVGNHALVAGSERQRSDEADDMLDIERPEDPKRLDPAGLDGVDGGLSVSGGFGTAFCSTSARSIDHGLLRNIELEVMEMRASLENQGLFRDAIEEICDEKRQRLIEEHEASLASPRHKLCSDDELSDEASEKEQKKREKDCEKDQEKENESKQKEKEKEKEKESEIQKEKDKEKERLKEQEKKDERVARENEKEKSKEKTRKETPREKDRNKEKARSWSRSTRSRSRENRRSKEDRHSRDKRRSHSRSRDRKGRSRSKERKKERKPRK
eukprot:TRINITY_DN3894_c0_g1_i1.p1 TRINITY_DN3894_c0_g1~~TRINITY_DN3894_c0_g1_i1.p1  ORF type:complete len:1165 (+),score=247.60 TRINITY_DN3894_c0_g1_i1:210-3704(+)